MLVVIRYGNTFSPISSEYGSLRCRCSSLLGAAHNLKLSNNLNQNENALYLINCISLLLSLPEAPPGLLSGERGGLMTW